MVYKSGWAIKSLRSTYGMSFFSSGVNTPQALSAATAPPVKSSFIKALLPGKCSLAVLASVDPGIDFAEVLVVDISVVSDIGVIDVIFSHL